MHRSALGALTMAVVLAVATDAHATPPSDSESPWNRAQLAMRAWSDRDGLPQNTVAALAFDSKGALWIGTQDGLAVYDGRGFRSVALPEGVHSIHAIVISADDTVYVGTTDAGVVVLSGADRAIYDTHSGLPDDEIYDILLAEGPPRDEDLWIATNSGVAHRSHGAFRTYSKAEGLPAKAVIALGSSFDAKHARTLWAGTSKGLSRLDGDKWVDVPVPSMPGRVTAILDAGESDRGGAIWVATPTGVCKLRAGTCEERYGSDGTPPIVEPRKLLLSHDVSGHETLWVGTDSGGAVGLAHGAEPIVLDQAHGLPGNIVTSLAVSPASAPAHELWVGMNSRGLARLEVGTWRSIGTSQGLPSPSVYSLLESRAGDGTTAYWVGTLGGLVKWDANDPHGWVNTHVTDKPVLALMQARDGGIWVGSDGGITELKDGNTTWYRPSDGLPGTGLLSMLETSTPAGVPRIWAATQEGMALIEDRRVVKTWHTADGLPSDLSIALAETFSRDGARTIWVGTMVGLASIDESTLVVTKHPFGASPGAHFVLSLRSETDAAGVPELWVGTKAGPFHARIEQTEPRWEPLAANVLAKFPNLVVNQMLRDKAGRMHVFTNRGVVRLEPDGEVTVFGVDDGLPSSECNTGAAIVDDEGRIWAGTADGVALFDPRLEIHDRTPKTLAFEDVVAGSKTRPHGLAGARLRYDESHLVYTYALASFFKEGETRYRSQLDGWESSATAWTPEARREYDNLPAGSYTFRVWGRDAAGNESGPVTDSFVVLAAPWKTGWAYAGYVLALALVGLGVVRLRERALVASNRELAANVAARTKELAEKNGALEAGNEELAKNLEQRRVAEQRAEAKASELDRNMAELRRVNEALVASHQEADRIFSALAEALPGKVIDGKYRLEARIGSGGFGAVFRAEHLGLRRPVAVKVFRPSPGNDSAEAIERFRREGETTSRLDHPNAVRVFDAGVSSDGIAYMVMEVLLGHTLAEELEDKHRLTLARTVEVLVPVCSVLEAAHRIGLVHRDVKPSNVFLHQEDGHEVVKVVDFGLAKMVRDDFDTEQQKLTMTGRIVGTPVYMAPERLGSRTSDTPSDVYSVGVVAYEMLTGQTPFKDSGENLVRLLLAHLHERPRPVGELVPGLPAAVGEVIMSALAAEPSERPTIGAFASRLAAAAHASPYE
jgi:ligand-binding sensor domain-containing protein